MIHVSSLYTFLSLGWSIKTVVIKMAFMVPGLELGIDSLESGALLAFPFPAGTLIICRAVYLFVHCAHFIALSMSQNQISNRFQKIFP